MKAKLTQFTLLVLHY